MIDSNILSRFIIFFILEVLTVYAFYELSNHYVFSNNVKPYTNPSPPQLINKIWSILKWSVFSVLGGGFAFFLCFNTLKEDGKITSELFTNSFWHLYVE